VRSGFHHEENYQNDNDFFAYKGKKNYLERLGYKPITSDPKEYSRDKLWDTLILSATGTSDATFSFNSADGIIYDYAYDDNKITIYLDTENELGDSRVSKKEAKHFKKQAKKVEKVIDKVTMNYFDIEYVDDPSAADIKVINIDDDEDSLGYWDSDGGRLVYQSQEDGKKLRKWDIKNTISHEIGHMFGLDHVLGNYFDSHPNTIMGGDEKITKLTKGDLNLITQGWGDTFDFMYGQELAY